jgi:hypothetical protein
MAGFEPATSCSKISSARLLDVAGRRPLRCPAGVTLAECRWKSPDGCVRWLPLWLPPGGRRRLDRGAWRLDLSTRAWVVGPEQAKSQSGYLPAPIADRRDYVDASAERGDVGPDNVDARDLTVLDLGDARL